jgi:dolichyl-diphosphooligosaccharide--protein glycosyltransferase
VLEVGALLALMAVILYSGVQIRLHATTNYGAVIHEFDPWFNYRATEYLVNNGWEAFNSWFDTEVWYPLGRPVGSTIYPGMQVTSAGLFYLSNYLDLGYTLNEICVYVPAGFSIFACLFTYGIAFEAYRSHWVAAAAMGFMSIIPAHLMRSVAGGYDNESIAISLIVSTFYLWVRSLRTSSSWPFAFLTALSYFYMVATWGAYTFVLNMIGVHAAVSILLGRYSDNLHMAYSIFYVFGTIGALQIQIVGWQPLQSMEQLGPMGVFFAMQVVRVLRYYKAARKMGAEEYKAFCKQSILAVAGASVVVLYLVLPEGFVGPLSARVRGLFVPHTRTGNPLVDSVAEHQATPSSVYFQYFHNVILLSPIGLALSCRRLSDAKIFVICYFLISGYFSSKMIRLVLLLAPAACITSGQAVVQMLRWAVWQVASVDLLAGDDGEAAAEEAAEAAAASSKGGKGKGGKKAPTPSPAQGGQAAPRSKSAQKKQAQRAAAARGSSPLAPILDPLYEEYKNNSSVRMLFAVLVLAFLAMGGPSFVAHCRKMAPQLSEPQIMLRSQGRDGSPMMIDDFRESYWWLRDNTPENARVMAWWDYGYQINGVANRTSIADGNTWNHEHIALLGKCLISPEPQAYKLIRHLADYVLIWTTRYAGMAGDDLAKHPHMARIGGSVYSDIKDPMGYFMNQDGTPSDNTRKTLLYKLHSHRLNPDVEDLVHFEEAYSSKYNMVRIYKVKNVSEKSRREVEQNPGQYPKALRKTLATMKAFKQH